MIIRKSFSKKFESRVICHCSWKRKKVEVEIQKKIVKMFLLKCHFAWSIVWFGVHAEMSVEKYTI